MKPLDPNSARGDLEGALGQHGQVVMPGDAQSPILTAPVRAALHQWLFEMNAEDELREVGLKPRSRCLLSGPPGCGKTTLAHHIAARLGLPMLVVQSHEIISKWKGETGQNVGKLFREARRQHMGVALFFDEFDALGTKRENMSGSGADNERAATTIALLQEFDRFDGLLFAATNVTGAIDPALWRRFQMQIEIGMPGPAERFAIVRMYMDPFAADDETITAIATALDGASPALIREGCETIKRGIVLGPKMGLPTDLPALVERFANGAAPAEGMPIPLLWSDRRGALNALRRAPWPPERP